MINEPVVVTEQSFQQAWLAVISLLKRSSWDIRNLIVQIKNTQLIDNIFHQKVSQFASREGLLSPKHVAYTIFPQGLYEHRGDAAKLFHAYDRPNGFFERLNRRKPGWDTYFRRMTHYEKTGEVAVNQLDNIIRAICTRDRLYRSALTIVIQNPGSETVLPRGGPCLNYISVQLEPTQPITLGLLAVYRNHDFIQRAYGNYWGLCNLLNFLATEVKAVPGPLTCVSSHAYVANKKKALMSMVGGL